MRTILGLAIAAALGLLATSARAQDPKTQRLPRVETIDTINAITVQNERKVPVTVYLDYGRFDRRLGVVPAQQVKTLAVPGFAVKGRRTLRLYVHPEGEVNELATQTFTLAPPGRIALLVPPAGGMPVSADTMTEVIPPEALDDATLTVENPRDRAVTIFVQQGRFDVRLGTVPAHGRVTLRFPKNVVLPSRSILVTVQPEGGRDLSSQTMSVKRGEHLGLRVPPS